eukprot:6209445-Pleurochrysis_carterae.AAC.3
MSISVSLVICRKSLTPSGQHASRSFWLSRSAASRCAARNSASEPVLPPSTLFEPLLEILTAKLPNVLLERLAAWRLDEDEESEESALLRSGGRSRSALCSCECHSTDATLRRTRTPLKRELITDSSSSRYSWLPPCIPSLPSHATFLSSMKSSCRPMPWMRKTRWSRLRTGSALDERVSGSFDACTSSSSCSRQACSV